MDPTITIDRDNLHITLPINGMSNIDRPFNRWSTFDWGPLDVADEDFPDGKIAGWAVEQLKRTYEQPFFLAVGFYKPHLPWYVPRKYFDLYDPDNISSPPHIQNDLSDISQTGVDYALLPWTAGCHSTVLEHDQWRPAVHAYLATISFVDAQVGRLLQALEESPHAGNTVVVFFSDHGFHLGEKEHWGKHAPWRNATRVPLIIRPARGQYGQYVPGVQCRATVNLLDIYPSLVELCGLPDRESLEGKSLLPLVLNVESPWENATVTTVGRGTHCVSTDRWRYIRYYDGSEELYDLDKDPEEWNNLAGIAGHEAVQAALGKHIMEDHRLERFVRWDKWKAVKQASGEMMLFDIYEPNGISEQHDVGADHPEIVRRIRQYLEQHEIAGRYVRISD
jgi:arylsulfatase A-like enzyme